VYTLNPLEIAKFDLKNASQFVDFWSQFYNDSINVFESEERIDYLAELNIGKDLTEENVRRLLRWKDRLYLTERIRSGPNEGKDNKRVLRVLEHVTSINQFRNDLSTEDDMRKTTAQIFHNRIVWKAFLLHIAKPHSYPIADGNVFQACSLHTGLWVDHENWATYAAYSDYFGRIAGAIGITRTVENIARLKRIDDALMVFGQFLRAYYRPAELSDAPGKVLAAPLTQKLN
jgi:hypothetical protein